MSNDTILSDDHVAELMAIEARDCSVKYATMGLEAFRSSQPKTLAKPNTRFLRQIIRETTNHNAALLAREAQESQARLDHLTASNEAKQRRLHPGANDIRRRQLGDISAILSGRKRKRSGESPVANDRYKDGSAAAAGLSASSLASKPRRPERRPRRSSSHPAENNEDADGKNGHHQRRHRLPDRHKEDDGHARDGNRHRRRSRSPRDTRRGRRHASASREASIDDPRKRPSQSRRSRSRQRDRRGLDRQGDQDEDPLDDFIGPAPPVKTTVRGRGRVSTASAMDKRFSDNYDARSDTQPDNEADSDGIGAGAGSKDWDESAEAYRDWQKWRQQGAARLRAAGFSEEQIKKWEKGGASGEKDPDDVRWNKAGEAREWDRGKVVGEDGTTSLASGWPVRQGTGTRLPGM